MRFNRFFVYKSVELVEVSRVPVFGLGTEIYEAKEKINPNRDMSVVLSRP